MTNISHAIESQFPFVYRQDGPDFVKFVEEYYKHLEIDSTSGIYQIRRLKEYLDIDTTRDEFLQLLKNTYLKNYPNLSSDDLLRFAVKNILALYKRKGTPESVRMFFRLFFDTDIELFYPSNQILRLSDSIYSSSSFLEMQPVSSYENYPIFAGDLIQGSITNASAYIESVFFKNKNGIIIPILVLASDPANSFTSADGLIVSGFRGTTFTTVNLGNIIYGSISDISVNTSNRSPGNKVGDLVYLKGSGTNAVAVVKEISDQSRGIIEFELEAGGYGYEANTTLNDVYISNQVFVLSTPEEEVPDFSPFDVISANSQAIYTANGESFGDVIEGSAVVLKYDYPVLYVYHESANNAFLPLLPGSYLNFDSDLSANTISVDTISLFNDSAELSVDSVEDTEQLFLVTDIIGEYANTRLDSSNYEMSGTQPQTINTALIDAFEEKEFNIGKVGGILVLDEGVDYENDVTVVLDHSEITKFEKFDIIVKFASPIILNVGDIMTQQIEISSFLNPANTVPYTTEAEFVRRVGDEYYFRQTKFYNFTDLLPVIIRGNAHEILTITRDRNSMPMGRNADITSVTEFRTGQIKKVDVVESGLNYQDGETVEIQAANGSTLATAVVKVAGQGKQAAEWKTTTSLLNSSVTNIHDNDYYQEYSYDVSTGISEDKYRDILEKFVSVSGTKLFTSDLISYRADLAVSLDAQIAEEVFVDINSVVEMANTSNVQPSDIFETESSNTNILSTVTVEWLDNL